MGFSLDTPDPGSLGDASAVPPGGGTCPILAALKGAAPGIIGGVAKAVGGMLAQRAANKQAIALDQANVTKPGFTDLGGGSFGNVIMAPSKMAPAPNLTMIRKKGM